MSKTAPLCFGKAAQFLEANASQIQMVNVPVHRPTGRQAVVKIIRSGVCHSDVHIMENSMGGMGKMKLPFPRVAGHEILGSVFAVGNEVANVREGDTVVVYPWLGCTKCSRCAAGCYNMCTKARLQIGVGPDGGFAEYVTVPDSCFLVQAEGLDPSLAALLPCSGLTAYGSVKRALRNMREREQESGCLEEGILVIIGMGGVGLMALQIAHAVSNVTVVCVDVNDDNLEYARKFGATHTVNSATTNVPKYIKSVRKSLQTSCSVEAVIDFVGISKTADLGLSVLSKGGALVVVGLHGGHLQLQYGSFPLRAQSMEGVFVGTVHDLKACIQLAREGKLKSTVSQEFPLEHTQRALELLQSGQIQGRAILSML